VLAIAAISLYSLKADSSIENHSFDAWKLKYSKSYEAKEEAYRIGIWLENFAYVQAHNKRF
jgi:hypothetical protein